MINLLFKWMLLAYKNSMSSVRMAMRYVFRGKLKHSSFAGSMTDGPQADSNGVSHSHRLDLFKPGVTLVGYVAGEFGVAENLRMACSALNAAMIPVDVYKIGTGGLHSEADRRFEDFVASKSLHAIQLFCVNADVLLRTQKSLGQKKTRDRYKIGYWFWELSNFPRVWWHAFDLVDEIWAPTKFIADTLAKVSPKPVIHMPVPVAFKLQGFYDREHFPLPEDRFLFLFSYDFHSFSQRKNPEACIAAFKLAFNVSDKRVGLVIKTINAEKHPEAFAKLSALAMDDDRISIVNKAMPRDEMYGLINICDAFLSLHRSEGFGLGMAEAMLLGKPVVGTGYSGNMDFMNNENSCIVDYTLIPVEREAYPYWEGQVWADPNIKQAAEYMKMICEDRAYSDNIANKGKMFIQQHHSLAVVGHLMQARLNKIDCRI